MTNYVARFITETHGQSKSVGAFVYPTKDDSGLVLEIFNNESLVGYGVQQANLDREQVKVLAEALTAWLYETAEKRVETPPIVLEIPTPEEMAEKHLTEGSAALARADEAETALPMQAQTVRALAHLEYAKHWRQEYEGTWTDPGRCEYRSPEDHSIDGYRRCILKNMHEGAHICTLAQARAKYGER